MAKEMTKEEIEDLLHRAQIGHLGTVDSLQPYVLPMHFLLGTDDCIYFHCGLQGKKLENLKSNPKVCFQVDDYKGIIPSENFCKFNTRYESVVIDGEAEIIEDLGIKTAFLVDVVKKFSGKSDVSLPFEAVNRTVVVKIVPTSISGKKND